MIGLRLRLPGCAGLRTLPALSPGCCRSPPRRAPHIKRHAGGTPGGTASSEEITGCMLPEITVNNTGAMTELTLQVTDYPGLLRLMSWVINGLGVRVFKAKISSTADGVARDTFWLTDQRGAKLSDDLADSVAERLGSFITQCAPDQNEGSAPATEFAYGNIAVSNTAHPDRTVLTIKGEAANKSGFLLELSYVLSSSGCRVHEGIILSEPDLELVDTGDYDFKKGRFFKFLVSDRKRRKLDTARIAALIFALEVVMGRAYSPVAVPDVSGLAVKT